MIGDDFIELRAELGTALYVLATLARDAQIPLDAQPLLDDLQSSLNDPFLLVVAGEVNAGKSTLLNALFGRDFCKTSVLPATDVITHFRYGTTSQEIVHSDTLVECRRPIHFLQDFEIVDTPGTNSIAVGHEIITTRFLPKADLVLFVFSITNPWAASAWDFVHQLQNRYLKNIAFVVQQIDLREPMEVEAVVEHLRQTAIDRLGRDCPIFAVSGKSAYLSKTTAIDKERLWKESRFEPLERYISQTVSSGSRLQKLQNTGQNSQRLLEELRTKLLQLHSCAQQDTDQLASIQRTLHWMRDQTTTHIDSFLLHLTQALLADAEHQNQILAKHLGPAGLCRLCFTTRWIDPLQSDRRLSHSSVAHDQIRTALGRFQEELDQIWIQITDALAEGLSSIESLTTPARPIAFLLDQTALTDTFTREDQIAQTEEAAWTDLPRALQKLAMRARLTLGATLATAGSWGAFFFTQQPWLQTVGIFLAFLTFALTLITLSTRRQVIDEDRAQAQLRQQRTHDRFRTLFQQITDTIYNDVSTTITPLRTRCEQRLALYSPITERFQQLHETFQRILHKLQTAPGEGGSKA